MKAAGKSRRRYWIPGMAIFLILSGVLAWFVFPPHGNLSRELPEGNFTDNELFQEFTGNPLSAYTRLANKVIILEGVVTATGSGYIMEGNGMCRIRCIFRKSIYDRKPVLKTGDRVTLKGVCQGLNLTEVVVTHCIMLNKSGN